MNQNIDERFSLAETLAMVTPLLQPQGPIKDFFHQNMLQVFIDTPFHEALRTASHLYGAKAYMDLSYYRSKYQHGEITEEDLMAAAEKQIGALSSNEKVHLRHALFNFVEIIDEKTLLYLLKKQNYSRSDIETMQQRLNVLHPHSVDISLRTMLNRKIGAAIEHGVNPIFFRLLGSYLDQGVMLWPLFYEGQSFCAAVQKLAEESRLPLASFVDNNELVQCLAQGPQNGVVTCLAKLFAHEKFYADYVKESVLNHPGWSGMVNVIAKNKDLLAKRREIDMDDFMLVKLALEWQFIKNTKPDFTALTAEEYETTRALAYESRNTFTLSLTYWLLQAQQCLGRVSEDLLKKIDRYRLQEIWHVALEQHYYASIARKFTDEQPATNKNINKKFQAIFCIDDRECSFRRYLEAESPAIETFGFPGFFGVEFFFKPHRKDLLEKMCPPPVTPKHVVMERTHESSEADRGNKKFLDFVSFVSRHGANSTFFGYVSAYTLGHLSAFRLLFSFIDPQHFTWGHRRVLHHEKTELVFFREDDSKTEDGLMLGFTHQEMAQRIFTALKNMGLVVNFAPVIFSIGHGSSSVNNPHFATYECGACSGRPGNINARLFAMMANIPQVRASVRELGITIPDETLFVGGFHDTCTDEVTLFDLDVLQPQQLEMVNEFAQHLAVVRGKNAQERCQWFALVDKNISAEQAIKEVSHRAKALFEPRPELGHALNALCIVGRRERSYGKNFNRRAFLQSYDPTFDENGHVLAVLMTALIPVCGGINFDYFLSRIDPAIYGCGSKLSHNVCSLIGVGNGLDDDLRTGLPIQMTELHDPVRLLIIIEQKPEIIMQAVFHNPALRPWMLNDWVKIASLCPHSNVLRFYKHQKDSFVEADLTKSVFKKSLSVILSENH